MTDLPTTMKAWQWSKCKDTLENAIQLNTSAPLPTASRKLASGESLIQVHVASLNPVDYKLPELPIVGRMAFSKPATPGLDFSGKVVEAGPDCHLKVGQMVYGKVEPSQAVGTLGEYIIGSKAGTIALPDGVDVEQASTLGVCGLVTYQALAPNVKAGDRVFINGGSGGTGTFAVQIAKALGCHVTTTCSGANAQLCKEIGADDVIDYRTTDVVETLSKTETPFDFVLDNIGYNSALYWKSPNFTKPGAKYVQIGAASTLGAMLDLTRRFLVPTALGGGKRPFAFGMTKTVFEDFTQLGQWMKEGKLKPVIDEVFKFEDAPDAYRKLKTGRAKGKIVVRVRGSDE